MLREVEKLEFTSLNQQQVDRCIQWIIESSSDLALPDAKGLYMCAVLGHLATTTSSSSDKCLQFPTHKATAIACDVLLKCLVTSFRKFLSPKCNKWLEAIAPVLVENSSSPGWLTFAANFLPLFGVKNIVEKNIVSSEHENETVYVQLCELLLSHDILNLRKASKEDRRYYNQFLTQILKLAPDEGTLFKVFANKEIRRFFYYQQDQDKFCADFYKDNFLTKSGADIREKLQQLIILPKTLRSQLSGVLYSYLLQFIKSVEIPTVKDVDNFMEIQLSLKLNDVQIHTILVLLSTSQIVLYQDLLLKLLNDDRFWNHWLNIRQTTKLEICSTWIKTRACAKELNEIKVAKVYKIAGEITSCTLVTKNKNLKKKLLQTVQEWLLQKVQPEVIFQELKDLDMFPQFDVRESCIHLIEDVLQNNLRTVNDKRLLSLFSQSR